jgi:hypothetical protein
MWKVGSLRLPAFVSIGERSKLCPLSLRIMPKASSHPRASMVRFVKAGRVSFALRLRSDLGQAAGWGYPYPPERNAIPFGSGAHCAYGAFKLRRYVPSIHSGYRQGTESFVFFLCPELSDHVGLTRCFAVYAYPSPIRAQQGGEWHRSE